MTAVSSTEVLEPGQRTLRELMDEANNEHALVMEDGTSLVEHAIRCGEALLAAEAQYIEKGAQESHGLPTWQEFAHDNFAGGNNRLHTYMRLARYQHEIRHNDFDSINGAVGHLVEIGAKNNTGRKPPPDWLIDEMKRLRAEGLTIRQVAAQVGKNRGYVQFWTSDPEAREARRVKALARWREQHAAAQELAEQRREDVIKRAARKKGGAIAKLYADAERTQDVLGQAHREATDPEARRELSEAGALHRKYRDKIVRALGVA